MRAVNLLPKEVPVKSFEAKRGVVFGAAGGFAVVTVALRRSCSAPAARSASSRPSSTP